MCRRYSWIKAGSVLIAVLAVKLAALAQVPDTRLCEQWRQAYEGEDATGGHVIGLWTFSDTKDASGKGLDAKLQGAVLCADGGRFGPCLETFCGHPVEDVKHAAVIAAHPALTPKGAFTLEMWIKPKKELAGYPEAFLADKKYVSHTDYQFTLGAADKSGQRRLNMRLGFGEDSENFVSAPALYGTGAWHHVAFTYDGAGMGRFFCDGASLGGAFKPGRGSVMAGKLPLSIGDRVGSLHHGFPGYIAQVRLCKGVLEFRSVTVAAEADRAVFIRMEKLPPLVFAVINLQRAPLKKATAVFSLDGVEVKTIALPDIGIGAKHEVGFPLDTSLRPGIYVLKIRVEVPGEIPYVSEEAFPVTLVQRRPMRMPVVMWGLYSPANVLREMPRLKEIGFTHCLGFGANYGRIFEAGKPVMPDEPERVEEVKRMLDTALANDVGVIAGLSPGHWVAGAKPALGRIDKNGKSNNEKPAVCAALPEVHTLCRNVGQSVALAYGAFPAWQAAMLHTEVRDGASICYHEQDRAAYRLATGLDYPEGVSGKGGIDYAKLKDFPADRVIADDHPVLRFLQWYWKQGDGWNALNTELHRGLKSTGRSDLWTFHDPAVRVASVYGSGGESEVISQWTYSYPDPIRIGVATDELFAMARGAAQPQRVMKMTQIIWYRSQTAPMAKGDEVAKATKSPWEDTDPDAAFPTIAPMHLREAFWTKLARPVQGIMYHGWGSLVPQSEETSYRYTHPQTQHELRRLVKEVVEPLGPTLMQVPDRPSDVAFLESFASQMFARRGTYGWGTGWLGDAYQMLMWARLQPEIVYDETVMQRGLDGFRVLVMMDCDVLTASVAAKVKAFQKGGGIIVGDERLCPAVKADIVIQSYVRSRKAADDRAALVAKAVELRKAVERRYQPYCDSTTPDIVTRCRTYGATDYLFAVNDLREFGDYVGQYGLVMENGLPSEATLSLGRKRGYVYDLVAGREVETTTRKGRLQIRRAFGPCEGCVLLVTDTAITGVTVAVPGDVKRGASAACTVCVVDKGGHPLDAVVPVRVEIRDPSGCEAEWSGYYGAKAGRLELKLDLASNDRSGLWQVSAKEIASGREAVAYFRVN